VVKVTVEVPSCGFYIFEFSPTGVSTSINTVATSASTAPSSHSYSSSFAAASVTAAQTSLSSATTTSGSIASATASSNQLTISNSSSLSTGAKIGIAIGAIAGALFFAAVGWFLATNRHSSAGDKNQNFPNIKIEHEPHEGNQGVHQPNGIQTYHTEHEIPINASELEGQNCAELEGQGGTRNV
jgi:hypothetical protein